MAKFFLWKIELYYSSLSSRQTDRQVTLFSMMAILVYTLLTMCPLSIDTPLMAKFFLRKIELCYSSLSSQTNGKEQQSNTNGHYYPNSYKIRWQSVFPMMAKCNICYNSILTCQVLFFLKKFKLFVDIACVHGANSS